MRIGMAASLALAAILLPTWATQAHAGSAEKAGTAFMNCIQGCSGYRRERQRPGQQSVKDVFFPPSAL